VSDDVCGISEVKRLSGTPRKSRVQSLSLRNQKCAHDHVRTGIRLCEPSSIELGGGRRFVDAEMTNNEAFGALIRQLDWQLSAKCKASYDWLPALLSVLRGFQAPLSTAQAHALTPCGSPVSWLPL
jgi:hypothetical protein